MDCQYVARLLRFARNDNIGVLQRSLVARAASGKGSINLGQKEKANGREGKSRIRQEDHECF